jgi:peptidoglycan/xylan/chitin deacetylase (PgdA/CDA1 family)
MRTRILILIITLLLVFSTNSLASGHQIGTSHTATQREIAVTFDDLPVASTRHDIGTWKEITNKLLKTISSDRIPAIGFVNENKLLIDGQRDENRIELLRMWIKAGLELGNHTFSHRSLNSTPLEEFESDVIRGEQTIQSLLAENGKKIRYFRHPFLQTGRSLEVKHQFESFLAARGYTIAPVTIDNSDWIFARAYDNARDAGDHQAMNNVGDAYVPYMERKIDYWEHQSVALFGREIKQVLLVHANSINADRFDAMVRMLRKRGYRLITLDEALKDSAYGSADTFTGTGGISWIHRWAITRGVTKDFFKGEPVTPDFVMKLAGVTSE